MPNVVKLPRHQSKVLISAIEPKAKSGEFVPAYSPELGHHLVSKPPSLLEQLVRRAAGQPQIPPVVKRGRGRPRKSRSGGTS